MESERQEGGQSLNSSCIFRVVRFCFQDNKRSFIDIQRTFQQLTDLLYSVGLISSYCQFTILHSSCAPPVSMQPA